MKITIKSKAGKVKPGRVREYRKYPANINLAVSAAAHYAIKRNERMIVVEGNSYGRKVYHVTRESDDLTKYTIMRCTANVLVLDPNGDCYYAIAE